MDIFNGNYILLLAKINGNSKAGRFRLSDVLKKAIQHSAVTGEIYQGVWYNVGTPHELQQAKARA